MQESNSGVNPQETVSEVEKGWLAGIIDGEGCIHIDFDPSGGAHPYLTVTNTNYTIIEKVNDIWQRLGVGCRVYAKPTYSIKHSPAKSAMVIGHKRLRTALIAIMPYLVGKVDEALLLFRFVESRLGKSLKVANAYRGYSQEELAIIQSLKDYKLRNRPLRDYTLEHGNVEDIVRATRRRVEAGRNSQSHLEIGE